MRQPYWKILLISFFLIALSGCTLHFKVKEMEYDSEPPITESVIDEPDEVSFAMTDIDFL